MGYDLDADRSHSGLRPRCDSDAMLTCAVGNRLENVQEPHQELYRTGIGPAKIGLAFQDIASGSNKAFKSCPVCTVHVATKLANAVSGLTMSMSMHVSRKNVIHSYCSPKHGIHSFVFFKLEVSFHDKRSESVILHSSIFFV